MAEIVNIDLERVLRDIDSKAKKTPYNPEFKRKEGSYNPSLQIDWITAKIPFYAKTKLNGGNIINTTPDGEIEYMIDKRLPVTGSYDSRLSIRSHDVAGVPRGETWFIELSGNPVKWFQGHNIFGTEDLTNLIYETVLRLADILDCPQPDEFLQWIKEGTYCMSRVDLTGMYCLPTRSDVYAWLNHAEKTCRTRSGTALSKGTTVYLNKRSARWNVVMYSKGQELEVHKLPAGLVGHKLEDFADNKLRIELRLRGKELDKIGLVAGSSWLQLDPMHIYKDYVGRIEMTARNIRDEQLLDIPKFARMSYQLWLNGEDIRQFVSIRKYYKDRKALLELGIDISVPRPSEDDNLNVVPLKRVLELKPSGVPDWAMGTKLYFEPRKAC